MEIWNKSRRHGHADGISNPQDIFETARTPRV
jgi:hypothetical protein